jgi:bacterial/archaeal transporter family-2 protein
MPSVRSGLGRVRSAVRTGKLSPYLLLGGTCGAFLVSCQGLTVGTIGVAVFTVAVVAGQATSSLVVDRAGIGPGGVQPISTSRVIGAGIALAAVVLSVSERLGDADGLALAILPAIAGIGIAWQQAVNGRVGAAARGPYGAPGAGALPASVMNFVTGTLALAVAVLVDLAVRGTPEPFPSEPWLYLGGLFGLVFIALAAAIVPYTGVLLLGLGTVAGQVVGALVLDAVIPAGDDHLSVTTVLGTALTLVAVGVAAFGSRRAGAPTRSAP